jgi:hypothetical protein
MDETKDFRYRKRRPNTQTPDSRGGGGRYASVHGRSPAGFAIDCAGKIPPVAIPALELDLSDEQLRVIRWRACQLENLGFSTEQAELLASDTAIPLEDARKLLNAGCPIHHAMRILL